MAIYSLHHQPIGKSTQARPYTAAAHLRYITRPSAMSRVDAARMPRSGRRAAQFLQREEDGDRKNGRVADKVMLALPRELDPDQRAHLVRGFAEEVTQGKAPWLAAYHDKGKDKNNPHVHLVIRDKDDKGKRVAGLSEKGSTDRLRSLWEGHANRALEGAGRPERIDRRTLEAQGVERTPTIHEGPKAREMEARGATPQSQIRTRRNAPGARSPARQVDYHRIDGGRSRPGYNRNVPKETSADYWSAIDADKQGRELAALRAIHHPPMSRDIGAGRQAIKPRTPFGKGTDMGADDDKKRQPQLPNMPGKSPGQGAASPKVTPRSHLNPKQAQDKSYNPESVRQSWPSIKQAKAPPPVKENAKADAPSPAPGNKFHVDDRARAIMDRQRLKREREKQVEKEKGLGLGD